MSNMCCLHVACDVVLAADVPDGMAVYSQQPTACGAPRFRGVDPHRWRPRRTADKSSAAPCAALPSYS